jgi:hypothetical protein
MLEDIPSAMAFDPLNLDYQWYNKTIIQILRFFIMEVIFPFLAITLCFGIEQIGNVCILDLARVFIPLRFILKWIFMFWIIASARWSRKKLQ